MTRDSNFSSNKHHNLKNEVEMEKKKKQARKSTVALTQGRRREQFTLSKSFLKQTPQVVSFSFGCQNGNCSISQWHARVSRSRKDIVLWRAFGTNVTITFATQCPFGVKQIHVTAGSTFPTQVDQTCATGNYIFGFKCGACATGHIIEDDPSIIVDA
jgi:hypothetical protein